MTQQWTVEMSDGRRIEVTCDELTTRPCGALFLLKAVDKPPAALVTVLVLARGTWQSCYPADSPILFTGEGWGGPRPPRPEPPPRTPIAL